MEKQKQEKTIQQPSADEVTPEKLYYSRREFMKIAAKAGMGAALAWAAAACGVRVNPDEAVEEEPAGAGTLSPTAESTAGDLTPFETVTNYNNYYEFTLDKEDVAPLSEGFAIEPYTLEISGLVKNPITLSLDDILTGFIQEERIYRLRCVEGWSMVIPWTGFQLSDLLEQVEPTDEAKFVRFETIHSPEQMPGQRTSLFPWPYEEGLRLDEAMHPLTLMATGLYAKPLPPQNGTPLRLVVPWKYGFKSIKSIVKIELVADMPATLWNTVAPNEYGFYANVNPQVPHPRWSQATERVIGKAGRQATRMFNGYESEVAYLYEGMDLNRDY